MSTANGSPTSNAAASAASSATKSASTTPVAANTQSIINSIRTIAKTKELEQKVEKLIQAQTNQALPGLNAERLIAQQVVTSAGSVGSSSAIPRDDDKDPGSVTDDASQDAGDAGSEAGSDVFNDGGVVNPSDTGSTDKSTSTTPADGGIFDTGTVASAGVYAAADILTNKGPKPSEKGDANADAIKSILGTIGAKKVTAHLRGLTQYDNVPDGWTDADTPPHDTTYTPGRVWVLDSGVGKTFTTMIADFIDDHPSSILVKVENLTGNPSAGFELWTCTSLSPQPGDYLLATSSGSDPIGKTTGMVGGTGYPFRPFGTGGPGYGQVTCESATGEIATVCALPAPPPLETEFPISDYVGLGWNGTRWEAHPYDTDGKKIVNRSPSILYIKGADNISYELGPTFGGGHYFAPVDLWPGTTPAMLIRPNGTIQGVIDKGMLGYYTGNGYPSPT